MMTALSYPSAKLENEPHSGWLTSIFGTLTAASGGVMWCGSREDGET